MNVEIKISIHQIVDELEQAGLLADFRCPRELYDHEFTYLSYNSADVQENTFFICKGVTFKEQYLQDALNKGAGAYLAQSRYENVDAPFVQVTDIRKAMSLVAMIFYGHAWKDLSVVGLTGTKGKTTTTYFIKNILDKFCGKRSGVLSTVEVYTGVEDHEAHLTTPESIDLQKHFAQCKMSDIPYLTMEVSSQAYKMDRVYGMEFDVGLFLNMGVDHVGPMEHESEEDYRNCKLQLMKHCKHAVLNRNADHFDEFYSTAKAHAQTVTTYGTDERADYWVSDIQKEEIGFSFVVHGKDGYEKALKISMAGRFNVENALAAFCAAKALGVDEKSIEEGLFTSEVKGRMNLFEKDGVTVIVDYAHNHLSFSKLYESLKLDYPGRRIVVVVGAPGGKNFHRRREIAQLSGQYADYMILTAEDPGFENVTDICKDIASYLEPYGTPYEIIEDRAAAVEKSILQAQKGDVIILAAKGEEVYQKVRGGFEPYESDLVIAQRCMK